MKRNRTLNRVEVDNSVKSHDSQNSLIHQSPRVPPQMQAFTKQTAGINLITHQNNEKEDLQSESYKDDDEQQSQRSVQIQNLPDFYGAKREHKIRDQNQIEEQKSQSVNDLKSEDDEVEQKNGRIEQEFDQFRRNQQRREEEFRGIRFDNDFDHHEQENDENQFELITDNFKEEEAHQKEKTDDLIIFISKEPIEFNKHHLILDQGVRINSKAQILARPLLEQLKFKTIFNKAQTKLYILSYEEGITEKRLVEKTELFGRLSDPEKQKIIEIQPDNVRKAQDNINIKHHLQIFDFEEFTVTEYELPIQYSPLTVLKLSENEENLIIFDKESYTLDFYGAYYMNQHFFCETYMLFLKLNKSNNEIQYNKYLFNSVKYYNFAVLNTNNIMVFIQTNPHDNIMTLLYYSFNTLEKIHTATLDFPYTLYGISYHYLFLPTHEDREIQAYDLRYKEKKFRIQVDNSSIDENDYRYQQMTIQRNKYMEYKNNEIYEIVTDESGKISMKFLFDSLMTNYFNSDGRYYRNHLNQILTIDNGVTKKPFILKIDQDSKLEKQVLDVFDVLKARDIIIRADQSSIILNKYEYHVINQENIFSYDYGTKFNQVKTVFDQGKGGEADHIIDYKRAFRTYEKVIVQPRIVKYCLDEQLLKEIDHKEIQDYELVEANQNEQIYLFQDRKRKGLFKIFDRPNKLWIKFEQTDCANKISLGNKSGSDYCIYMIDNKIISKMLIDPDGKLETKHSKERQELCDIKHQYFAGSHNWLLIVKDEEIAFTNIQVLSERNQHLESQYKKLQQLNNCQFISFNSDQTLLVYNEPTKMLFLYQVVCQVNDLTIQILHQHQSDNEIQIPQWVFNTKDKIFLITETDMQILERKSLKVLQNIHFQDSRVIYAFDLEFKLMFDKLNWQTNQYAFYHILNLYQYGFKDIHFNVNQQLVKMRNSEDLFNLEINYSFKFLESIQIFKHIENIELQNNNLSEQINELRKCNFTLQMIQQVLPTFNYYTFFHFIVQRNPILLNEIEKIIDAEFKVNKKSILFMRDNKGETPIDIAIGNRNTKCVNVLFNWLLQYQNHFIFNYVMDRHLVYLIQNNYEIKDYLESELVLHSIQNNMFIGQSTNDKTLILGIDELYLTDVVQNYDIVKKKITELDESAPKVNIEYYVINLPDTLTLKPQEFMKQLSQSDDLKLFDTLAIQTVINFKWQQYTKRYFLYQLLIFILFLISFILDIYFYAVLGDERQIAQTATLKAFNFLCITIFLVAEINQLKQQTKLSEYFNDYWNCLDIFLIAFYPPIAIVDLTGSSQTYVTIGYCIYLIFLFFKLCFYLRIFDNFSFLVSMIFQVFKDLKYFMVFYAFVIILFGLMFSLLMKNDLEDITQSYQGIDWFGYFIMAFRASTGDFQTDSYFELNSELIIFVWIVWFLCVIFLNIILLNFIIAVISSSYENTMQNLNSKIYQLKVHMITERESLFNSSQLQDPDLFPRFILLRRPQAGQSGKEFQWEGFVKEIKNTIYKIQRSFEKNQQKMALDISHQFKEQLELNQANQKDINDKIDSISKQILTLSDAINHIAEGQQQTKSQQNEVKQKQTAKKDKEKYRK